MISMPANVLERMRAHAAASYPEECCGGLLGKADPDAARVLASEPVDNARDGERECRYLVSPQDYRRLEALAEGRGLDLLGFYHSHPDHPPAPSDYDREHAFPFFHYLILAVSRTGPGGTASFVLSEDSGTFVAETLHIDDIEE